MSRIDDVAPDSGIEVPEADAAEQSILASDDDEPDTLDAVARDADVPFDADPADALDQHRPVPSEDDDRR